MSLAGGQVLGGGIAAVLSQALPRWGLGLKQEGRVLLGDPSAEPPLCTA